MPGLYMDYIKKAEKIGK